MYTKGPWRFEKESGAIVGKRKGSDLPLCIGQLFTPIDDGLQWNMLEANARLIVAAPRLLESCEKLLEWIDNLEAQGYTDELINAMPNNFGRQVARKAIEEARG